jgi:MerR family copper efflux transcriptional regulator
VGTYRISQLAEQSGVPATTLRYYEKEGLLPAARTSAGYRSYTDADADRVQFISAAKHLGLPLDQIRELLGVWNGGMCREIRDELRPRVAAQIAAAEQRIEDLRTFRDRLDVALTQLRDLPAKDGPCDPACAFLDDLPDRVPVSALGSRPIPRPLPTPTAETGCGAVACSLEGGQYEERVRRWRLLLGDAPRTPARGGGITVRLPASHAAALADLAVAEQLCCPFFSFRLTFSGAYVELSAHAPDVAEPLVDALFGVTARNPQEPEE